MVLHDTPENYSDRLELLHNDCVICCHPGKTFMGSEVLVQSRWTRESNCNFTWFLKCVIQHDVHWICNFPQTWTWCHKKSLKCVDFTGLGQRPWSSNPNKLEISPFLPTFFSSHDGGLRSFAKQISGRGCEKVGTPNPYNREHLVTHMKNVHTCCESDWTHVQPNTGHGSTSLKEFVVFPSL